MKKTHNDGDWVYEPDTGTIRTKRENYHVASMDSWDGAVNNEANATRIVSCVNGCRGINPEAVPELLTNLIDLLDLCEKYGVGEHCDGNLIAALAAITKAKGEA